MLYIVTYDINNSVIESDFISELQKCGDSYHFVTNSWFLFSEKSLEPLYSKLQPFFKNGNGHILIARTKLDDMAGWLSETAIDWLRKHEE